MSETCRDDLIRLAEELNPGSVLAIGPAMEGLLANFGAAHPACRIDCLGPNDVLDSLRGRGVYDLVLLAGVLECMGKARAQTLLGCIRDQHARELAVLVPIGSDWPEHQSHWQRNELLGFGMSLQAVCEENGRPIHLYRFSLRNYKATPEWLNAKYWAHPELFGKYRW